MSKCSFDNRALGNLMYHVVGLIGVYFILTRYLDYAVPVLAICGVVYLFNLRKDI